MAAGSTRAKPLSPRHCHPTLKACGSSLKLLPGSRPLLFYSQLSHLLLDTTSFTYPHSPSLFQAATHLSLKERHYVSRPQSIEHSPASTGRGHERGGKSLRYQENGRRKNRKKKKERDLTYLDCCTFLTHGRKLLAIDDCVVRDFSSPGKHPLGVPAESVGNTHQGQEWIS